MASSLIERKCRVHISRSRRSCPRSPSSFPLPIAASLAARCGGVQSQTSTRQGKVEALASAGIVTCARLRVVDGDCTLPHLACRSVRGPDLVCALPREAPLHAGGREAREEGGCGARAAPTQVERRRSTSSRCFRSSPTTRALQCSSAARSYTSTSSGLWHPWASWWSVPSVPIRSASARTLRRRPRRSGASRRLLLAHWAEAGGCGTGSCCSSFAALWGSSRGCSCVRSRVVARSSPGAWTSAPPGARQTGFNAYLATYILV